MKKVFIFLFSFFILLYLASFINHGIALAECGPCISTGGLPSGCPGSPSQNPSNYTKQITCPVQYPNLPYGGSKCCTEDSTENTCTTLNYNGNPTSYECKDSCNSAEGESETSLGSCGTQKCCAFLTPPGAGGSTCRIDDDCLSRNCDNGKCEGGSVELVCNETDTGFSCKTAIGTINTDVAGFSKNILQILLGLSGGILLVMIIINGYKIMTSQGDPEKIKDAREGIIAAIAGILLIIFSVSILQLITVDIIGIPGFTK